MIEIAYEGLKIFKYRAIATNKMSCFVSILTVTTKCWIKYSVYQCNTKMHKYISVNVYMYINAIIYIYLYVHMLTYIYKYIYI
jgi:hypothetical protein